MYKKFCYLAASVLGAGFFPKAPGTMGSAVGVLLSFVCFSYSGITGVWSLALVSFVLGVFATKEVLKHTKHDPSFVVVDEVCGQALSFVFVSQYLNIWWVYLIGFLLFRLFDIVKIGPVKWADEKVANEYGVMLDDVFAGFISAVLLFFITNVWFS